MKTYFVIFGIFAILFLGPSAVFAETNTERIQNISGDTDRIYRMLKDVRSMVRDTVDMVQEMAKTVTMMASQMTQIFDMIQDIHNRTDVVKSIQQDIDDVRSDIDSMQSVVSADTIMLHQLLPAIHNRTDVIQTDMANMENEMRTTATTSIEANARAGHLSVKVSDMLDRLTTLEDVVEDLAEAVTAGTQRSAALETLILNIPSISDILPPRNIPLADDRTEDAQRILEDQEQERLNDIPGQLRQDSTSHSVTAYHFQKYGTQTNGVYILEMELSCNRDIYVDTMYARNRHSDTADDQVANTLTAEGRTIYHSQLNISDQPYDVSLDLGLHPMPVGTTFGLTAQQGGLIIPASSRANNTAMFDVVIEWYTVYDMAECVLRFDGKAGFSEEMTESGEIVWASTVMTGGVLNDYSDILDCQGSPVRITSVRANTLGVWPEALTAVADMNLRTLDSDADNDIALSFGTDGSISFDLSDFSYDTVNLEVHGTLPVVEGLVVRLNYLTTPDTVCRMLE